MKQPTTVATELAPHIDLLKGEFPGLTEATRVDETKRPSSLPSGYIGDDGIEYPLNWYKFYLTPKRHTWLAYTPECDVLNMVRG